MNVTAEGRVFMELWVRLPALIGISQEKRKHVFHKSLSITKRKEKEKRACTCKYMLLGLMEMQEEGIIKAGRQY